MDDEATQREAAADAPLDPKTREEGAKVIQSAFDAARSSGRFDWWRMTVAVLKNRILDVTNRKFDEARWGAQSFGDFVGLYPDVVSVDHSTHPPTVELVDHPDESPPAGLKPGDRIRQDLWRAVLDSTSGNTYVWRDDRAVVLPADEAADAEGEPRLPTIGDETLGEWRSAFVESLSPLPEQLADRAQRWQAGRLHDNVLPGHLRGRWNGRLKQHVLERLEAWFEDSGISRPDDVVEHRIALAAGRDQQGHRSSGRECLGARAAGAAGQGGQAAARQRSLAHPQPSVREDGPRHVSLSSSPSSVGARIRRCACSS